MQPWHPLNPKNLERKEQAERKAEEERKRQQQAIEELKKSEERADAEWRAHGKSGHELRSLQQLSFLYTKPPGLNEAGGDPENNANAEQGNQGEPSSHRRKQPPPGQEFEPKAAIQAREILWAQGRARPQSPQRGGVAGECAQMVPEEGEEFGTIREGHHRKSMRRKRRTDREGKHHRRHSKEHRHRRKRRRKGGSSESRTPSSSHSVGETEFENGHKERRWSGWDR